MMQVNYILRARGEGGMPDINHALTDAEFPEMVEFEMMKIVRSLSIAGYTQFIMWDVGEAGKTWNAVVDYGIVPPEEVNVSVEYLRHGG